MSACRRPDAARWTVCFALAAFFHVAGAAALLARWNDDAYLVANAPVIMIDLEPVPVAPQTRATDLSPGPTQAEAQPKPKPEKPLEHPEIKAAPAKEAELAVTPPPPEKPKDNKPKQKHASIASAPSTADLKSERAAAPAAGANSQNPNALPNWKSALVAQLERYKHYPSQARGESGIAQLAFSVDRNGGVHNARIMRSSGSSVLDQATLTLAERAAPLPPPPPEIRGAQIAIVVPIRYGAR